MPKLLPLVAFAISLAAPSFGYAQQPKPVRLHGAIEKIDGSTLLLKTRDREVSVALAPGSQIVVVVKSSMAEVKEGTFLGSAAMPQADGTQKAIEVHIFPESMRGTGEGHRPYEPVPRSTMTNGAATGATVAGIAGSVMTVKFKGGEKKIVVSPDTPVVRYEIGGMPDLKLGASVAVLSAMKKPDGSYETGRINVGRGGVVP